jgi:hypothetical protein
MAVYAKILSRLYYNHLIKEWQYQDMQALLRRLQVRCGPVCVTASSLCPLPDQGLASSHPLGHLKLSPVRSNLVSVFVLPNNPIFRKSPVFPLFESCAFVALIR